MSDQLREIDVENLLEWPLDFFGDAMDEIFVKARTEGPFFHTLSTSQGRSFRRRTTICSMRFTASAYLIVVRE